MNVECVKLIKLNREFSECSVSSELNVVCVKLIKLNRANFQCSVTQPNILM